MTFLLYLGLILVYSTYQAATQVLCLPNGLLIISHPFLNGLSFPHICFCHISKIHGCACLALPIQGWVESVSVGLFTSFLILKGMCLGWYHQKWCLSTEFLKIEDLNKYFTKEDTRMTYNHVKRLSTSQVIKEIQINIKEDTPVYPPEWQVSVIHIC